MAENLKVTQYESDRKPIPFVGDSETRGALGEIDEAYCWLENDISNKDIYGALYTWAAASNGGIVTYPESGYIQGACPSGWHLPSGAEWKDLEVYLGMSSSDRNILDFNAIVSNRGMASTAL